MRLPLFASRRRRLPASARIHATPDGAALTMPLPARTAAAGQGRGAESDNRPETFTRSLEGPPQALPEALAAALARLGHAIADRAGAPGGATEGAELVK